MSHCTWSPLLTGAQRDQALTAAIDIAEALRAWSPGMDAGLAGGATGLSIFYTYLAQVVPDRDYEATALAHLDRAMALVGQQRLGPSLYSGFTGVAWAIEHLTGRLLERGDEDPCADIDEALHRFLADPGTPMQYDLINGLAGLGVYALERMPRPSAAACLARIVELLDRQAEKTPEGVTWWTSPALLPPETRQACASGHYNIGLAHGIPAVIALLGAVCATGPAPARPGARALLDGAVSWLLAHQLDGTVGSMFSAHVIPGSPPRPSRQAWCYGDPGVAMALLVAGSASGQPGVCEHALRIARFAAAQPPERVGVIDAGLCHGAAGLAHLYHRIHRATGDDLAAAAARNWIGRLLAMRTPGLGIAGFRAWDPAPGAGTRASLGWRDTPGLLTGAAGIALALLAAATPVEPAWDRLLLVSEHLP